MASLFAMLGAGGAAGAAGAGAAAGAAAGAGGLFSSLGSIASVASTVIGGLASIAAGRREEAALKQQAIDEDTRAVQEEINGRAEALESIRALNAETARMAVAGYASGIGGSGSVEAAMEESLRLGERNVSMSRDNAAIGSAMRRGQGEQLRLEGRARRSAGVLGAVRGGLSLFTNRSFRG